MRKEVYKGELLFKYNIFLGEFTRDFNQQVPLVYFNIILFVKIMIIQLLEAITIKQSKVQMQKHKMYYISPNFTSDFLINVTEFTFICQRS